MTQTPQACVHAETSQAIMRLAPSPTTVFVVASAAISRRFAAPRLIFPDELPVSEPLDEGSFDGPNPSGATGFWTVYDDLATEDNLGKASRGEPTTSFLSTSMILRADGQTSRGSDFIKGRWELEKQEKIDAQRAIRQQKREAAAAAGVSLRDLRETPIGVGPLDGTQDQLQLEDKEAVDAVLAKAAAAAAASRKPTAA